MVEVGQVVGAKYKLLRLLGDGGMGSVYEAEHVRLGTRIALKVLHPDLTRRPGLIDRFLQEARVSAQIRSAHVVHVTDVDSTTDGIAYLVMELLQGEPLSGVLRRERTLSVGKAAEYTSQILEALEAAHALGVIHRDLKPDNVFVTFEGGKPVLKLIDFGIAKLKQDPSAGPQKNLTVAGMLMGTPEYMAPEQAYSADKVDVRADIYAVGVMLYEMLAGQPPVTGGDPRVVVLKVERGEVQPLVHLAPGVPPEVAGLVHRAMAPRPEMRFASATEMRLALEGVISGKRAGTAKIPGSAVAMANAAAAGTAPVPQVAAAAVAAAAPNEQALGTGTVMGAPVPGALSDVPDNNARPGTGTVRAAPVDLSLLSEGGHGGHAPPFGGPAPPFGGPPPQPAFIATPAPPYGATGVGSAPPPREPRRRGGGLIVLLAVVATLLGAGAVVAYVIETSPSNPPPPLPIDFAATTTPTGTATATATVPTPTVVVTTAAPLAPGPTQAPTQATARPTATATATATAKPTSTTSATPETPPFPFPSAPLPIPSVWTIPSGIAVPSGFPTSFPWPPQSPPSQEPPP